MGMSSAVLQLKRLLHLSAQSQMHDISPTCDEKELIKTDDYLTIGDFAKLRNVDRKSLRYYERIGALIPAYIDPQTKYRYYKLDQLVDLDTILLCLELGIPLKDAVNYKNQDGTLDILQLFNDGKDKINEKFLRLHITLKRLESSLSSIQESKPFETKDDFYRRHINKRHVLRKRFTRFDDELFFRKEAKNLFIEAQSRGLIPIFNFPIGLMVERINESLNIYITLELLPYEISNADIYTLPEGTYLCYQESSASLHNPATYCLDIFTDNPNINIVTISNMTLERYEKGIFPLEVQAFIG